MPAIRITYSENSLTAEQKAELAPLLIDAVMLQEVSPITEAARHITAVVFDEVPQHNSFGAQSFWLVEAMIAAGFLNHDRPRRRADRYR
jgi:phenylpyruvate tautomerase PptA (4-oxalocrotonate tautomerase family)